MDIPEEVDDIQSERVKHQLLTQLKTTIEGILATNASNVWCTYGGLSRLCKDVERILNHRLKFVAGDFGNVSDFWPFVKGLKWLHPVMIPYIEKIRKAQHQRGDSKGKVWIKDSLREHKLSMQLKVLVASEQHMHRHYFEDAFLFNPDYFKAMSLCLQALEENRVAILADIDPKLLHFNLNSRIATSNHIRSISLPVLTKPCHRSESQQKHSISLAEIILLAQPVTTTPCKENELVPFTEHSTNCCNEVLSTSPEDHRVSAEVAITEAVKKLVSPVEHEICSSSQMDDFSLYSISDPLLHVDLSQMLMSGSLTPENVEEISKHAAKIVIRSMSETSICKISDSKSPVTDKIIQESDTASQVINKTLTLPLAQLNLKETSNRLDMKMPSKESRLVFSDSESVNPVTKSRNSNENKSRLTHKRSRSDIVGMKTSVIQPPDKADSAVEPKITDVIAGSDESYHAAVTNCYFPRAQMGHSILQYLSSFEHPTGSSLDKENAHFIVSEAVIAAIELIRWKHEFGLDNKPSTNEDGGSDEDLNALKQQHIRIRKRTKMFIKSGNKAGSNEDTDLSSDEDQIDLTMDDSSHGNLTSLKDTGLSLSLASLYSDADIHKVQTGVNECGTTEEGDKTTCLSAEKIAVSFLKKFSEKDMPLVSDLPWLVAQQHALSMLPVSADDPKKSDQAVSSETCIRGNMEWAPPRPQIIFIIHPPPKRNQLLVKQNYQCAGCGMKVEPDYAKKFRYCDYLGKYFCHCCHSNQTAVIPARILMKWDFSKYSVSDFALDFLTKTANEPLFHISDVNCSLYKRVKVLEHVKDWRTQLHSMRFLLSLCKQATSVIELVNKLPKYLLEDVHLYSINDLQSIRLGATGVLYNQLKHITTEAISHVESCMHCQAFGFICEVCRHPDAIFPYEITKVSICPNCESCFHNECFVPQKCPKCARIEARKKRLEEYVEDLLEEPEHANDRLV